MASLFDDLDVSLQTASEDVFGEAIRVLPRVASDYSAATADTNRPARDTVAVVSIAIAEGTFVGQRIGLRASTAGKTALLESEIWLSAERYAALGYAVRKGDALLLTDREGSPAYQVTRVTPDAGGVSLYMVLEL